MRSSFVVQNVTNNSNGSKTIKLIPQHDQTVVSRELWKDKPIGELVLTIDNPAAFGLFENGRVYFLDLTPAETGRGTTA